MIYNPLGIRSGILVLKDLFFFFCQRGFCAAMLTWQVCNSAIKYLLWNVELCKQTWTCKHFCNCPSGFPVVFWSLCLHGFELLVHVVLFSPWMAAASGLFMIHMTSAYEASLISFTCLCVLKVCFYRAEFAKNPGNELEDISTIYPFHLVSVLLFGNTFLIAVFQGGIWRDWQDPIKANLPLELLSIKNIQHPQLPQKPKINRMFLLKGNPNGNSF